MTNEEMLNKYPFLERLMNDMLIVSTEEDNIEWGLIGIKDSSVIKNKLYSSDNVNKEITGYLRPIITLKDSVILNYKNNLLSIE